MPRRKEKFTAGTWRRKGNTIYAPGGWIIAEAWPVKDIGKKDPERRANAVLMAKAPKMYATIKACVEALEYAIREGGVYIQEILVDAQANAEEVLKEARGEK